MPVLIVCLNYFYSRKFLNLPKNAYNQSPGQYSSKCGILICYVNTKYIK